MLRRKTIPGLLMLSAASACTAAGDFCDVSEPIRIQRDVAEMLVATDRPAAVNIAAHNTYGERVCGW
jgi:hypothetical protein